MKIILLASLAILATGTARAQNTPQKADCSIILTVSGAVETPQGEDLTFSVGISGEPAGSTPTFNWSVSAGTITTGQGTPVIIVSSKELKAGKTITATIDIGGLPTECGYNSDSATTGITAAPPKKKGSKR